jgi:two-component system LytT family sensor kinase
VRVPCRSPESRSDELRAFRSSWVIIPALGLGFALFFSTWNHLRDLVFGMSGDPRPGWIESFSRWMASAALAPLVGLLVARVPLYGGDLARRLPLHVAAGFAFAIVQSFVVGVLYVGIGFNPRGLAWTDSFVRLQMMYFALNVLVYWAISGAYHAIRYHHEVVRREKAAAALEAKLTQARLDGLRAQLNPHFLFNTLNAISSLALTGAREQVAQTLSELSDLLRVSLDRDLPQEIPLARELEILERYLGILRTRFGDRLRIDVAAGEGTREALVPSMLLQPLVENALEHGIAVVPGPGRVTIRATRAGERLSVRVEDSGVGFRDGAGDGIGLSNTRARLEQLYGESQRFTWGNRAEGGAFVEASLPFRLAPRAGGGA